MAEEDQRQTIRTSFGLEEYNEKTKKALFKQDLPLNSHGRFHYWAMDKTDWDFLGRPSRVTIVISSEEENYD